MGRGKFSTTNKGLHTVAGISFGTTLNLFSNHIIGGFHNLWEGEPAWLTNGAKHRHGVVLHHPPNRLSQGFRGNGTQVRAVAASQSTLVNYRHTPALLDGIHGCAFTARTAADNH